jgi:hypothetical protein
MNREPEITRADRWEPVVRWFLFLSYAIGAPAFAIVEARTGLFSGRFNYPPEFLYLVSATQFVCALALFVRAIAPWSTVCLTAITVGAVISHLRINSAISALPALVYMAIQIWYGIRVYRHQHDKSV